MVSPPKNYARILGQCFFRKRCPSELKYENLLDAISLKHRRYQSLITVIGAAVRRLSVSSAMQQHLPDSARLRGYRFSATTAGGSVYARPTGFLKKR